MFKTEVFTLFDIHHMFFLDYHCHENTPKKGFTTKTDLSKFLSQPPITLVDNDNCCLYTNFQQK